MQEVPKMIQALEWGQKKSTITNVKHLDEVYSETVPWPQVRQFFPLFSTYASANLHMQVT